MIWIMVGLNYLIFPRNLEISKSYESLIFAYLESLYPEYGVNTTRPTPSILNVTWYQQIASRAQACYRVGHSFVHLETNIYMLTGMCQGYVWRYRL